MVTGCASTDSQTVAVSFPPILLPLTIRTGAEYTAIEMRRLLNGYSAFLFGCGILALCVGLFSDTYSWKWGVIIMITLWVCAFAFGGFMADIELPATWHHGDVMVRRYLTGIGAFIFGCGILVLVVGLLSDLYTWQNGLIGMIALWVADLTGAVYYLTPPDD
jgi:MFS family permease